jgi:hypothetical protein
MSLRVREFVGSLAKAGATMPERQGMSITNS